VNPHGGHPEDESKKCEAYEKPTDIGMGRFVNAEVVAEQDDGKGDPKRSVTDKGAVAKVVTTFKLLKPSNELGESTKNNGECEHGTNPAPTDIVELEDECGDSESGESYDSWITLFGRCLGHDVVFLSGEVFLLKMS
jgi:hypothetical protein